MSAPTLVPPSLRRRVEVSTRSSFAEPGRAVVEHAGPDGVAFESLDRTQRHSNSLRWLNTRRALDKMLLCWIGVLVAALVVLAFR